MEHLTEGKMRLTLVERLRRNPTKQNEGIVEDFLKKYATDIKAGKFKTGLELSKQVYEDQGNEYFVVLKYTLGEDDFARKPEDPSMMESTRVQAEKTFKRAMSEILEYSKKEEEHLTESPKIPEEVKSYLREHILQSLEEAGVDWQPLKKNIDKSIEKKVAKIDNILSNGLDIGTLKEHRIPVRLVNHPKFGWCFDGGKKYGLYPLIDNLEEQKLAKK